MSPINFNFVEIQAKERKRLLSIVKLSKEMGKIIEAIETIDIRLQNIREHGARINVLPHRGISDFTLIDSDEAAPIIEKHLMLQKNKLIARLRELEKGIYNLQPRYL